MAQKCLFSSVHPFHCAIVIACMYLETEISHRATAIISSVSRTLCGTTITRRLKIIEPCHWDAYHISWVSRTLCGTTVEHKPKIIASCHRDHYCISRADFWCRRHYVSYYPKIEWLSTLSCVFVPIILCVLVVLPIVLVRFEVLSDRQQDHFSLFMNLSLYIHAIVVALI